MGKIIRAAVLLLVLVVCPHAEASTVSGTLKDIGGAAITGRNGFVRMELRNFGAAIPKVSGTNIIAVRSKDFFPNASGNISGDITGNDTITPAQTFYRVCLFYQGVLFRCNDYDINGASFNLNTATPRQP